MSHFDQKPVRIKRDSSKKNLSFVNHPKKRRNKEPLFPRSQAGRKVAESRHYEEKAEKERSSGFSFTIPSLGTLAVIAGIVVIALAAYNWEEFDFGQPVNTAIIPLEDTYEQESSLRYAAARLHDLLPSVYLGEREQSARPQPPQNTAAAAPENRDESYNDLSITFTWQEYKVQRGDSVSRIAQRYGVSIGAIIASNEIRNARALREGAVIRIPNIDGIPYTIKNGDSLSKIAASFNVPLEVILDVNDIKSDRITAGETIFIPGARMNDIDLRLSLGESFMYPIQGRFLTDRFGMRKDPISGALNFHTGIDLRANTGTPVVASLDGVISVVSENWLYGKHIIISHDNGYKSLYAHLNSFSVRQGDRVARGRKIGETGNTGYSTGPHLHFGIYDRNNRLVNPLELLN